MKIFFSFLLFFLSSTSLWAKSVYYYPYPVAYIPKEEVTVYYKPEKPKPLVTGECVREGSFDRCKEYDYTYSVAGAQCEAQCLVFNSFDKCKLRNQCKYDENSGCFLKRTCIDINNFDDCDKWEDEAVCGT
ncbi:hypothetical protein K1X76_09445 [bacterium]|nr:hypothetical protein [bacterium]